MNRKGEIRVPRYCRLAFYGTDGLRAWKSLDGSKTYFLYGEDGDPVVEMDSNGAVLSCNVFAPDGLVARDQAGTWTQYAFDEEGNVAQRLSATGTVLSSSVYDGYGGGGVTPDPFGYHAQDGYYTDVETGLVYCQNRYYDPGAGRWVTRDPLSYDGGINLYGYCAGGPVGASDPEGLQKRRGRRGAGPTAAIAVGPTATPPVMQPTSGPVARALAALWAAIGAGGCAVGGAALLIILTPPNKHSTDTGRTDGGGGFDGPTGGSRYFDPRNGSEENDNDPEQVLRKYIIDSFDEAKTRDDCERIAANVGATIAKRRAQLRKMSRRKDEGVFRSLMEQFGWAKQRCIERTRGK